LHCGRFWVRAFPGLESESSTPATWTCRWGPQTWGTQYWGRVRFAVSHPSRAWMGHPAFRGLEWDDLEAAGPLGEANSLLDRRGCDGKVIARGELDGGCDGESDVAVLMGAVEGRCDLNGGAECFDAIGTLLLGFSDGSRRSEGSMRQRHVGNGADSADIQLGGDFAENLIGFGMLRQGD